MTVQLFHREIYIRYAVVTIGKLMAEVLANFRNQTSVQQQLHV